MPLEEAILVESWDSRGQQLTLSIYWLKLTPHQL